METEEIVLGMLVAVKLRVLDKDELIGRIVRYSEMPQERLYVIDFGKAQRGMTMTTTVPRSRCRILSKAEAIKWKLKSK